VLVGVGLGEEPIDAWEAFGGALRPHGAAPHTVRCSRRRLGAWPDTFTGRCRGATEIVVDSRPSTGVGQAVGTTVIV
jgi:hypothetical protein